MALHRAGDWGPLTFQLELNRCTMASPRRFWSGKTDYKETRYDFVASQAPHWTCRLGFIGISAENLRQNCGRNAEKDGGEEEGEKRGSSRRTRDEKDENVGEIK